MAIAAPIALAGAVGWLACRMGWLTRGGAFAACAVGGTIFAFGRFPGAALLLVFFISSSLLTRLPRSDAAPGAPGEEAVIPKRSARNGRQVLANGAIAALAAAWSGWLLLVSGTLFSPAGIAAGGGALTYAARLALAGAIAAAAADTWATEIGLRIGGAPRSALTGRIVPRGESGGVTLGGAFAGMAGAALVGSAAAALWPDFGLKEAVAVEAAGFIAMGFDSLLGASLQYRAYCSTCGRGVEEPRHIHPIERARGLRILDNDAVNLLATLAGALLAIRFGS